MVSNGTPPRRNPGFGPRQPSRSSHPPRRGDGEPPLEDITLWWLLTRFFAGLKLLWVAIRYRWRKANNGAKIGRFRLPWLQLGFIVVAIVLVSQKNIHFSLDLKAPLAGAFGNRPALAAKTAQIERQSIAESLPFIGSGKSAPGTLSISDLDPIAVDAYINRFGKVAIAEMRKFGIPASVKMAQGILESHAGSVFVGAENNHFGAPLAGENYVSAWENWRAHSLYLRREYAEVFESAYGYKQWAKALQQRGYSPDRKYADKLIAVIEKYRLHQLDE